MRADSQSAHRARRRRERPCRGCSIGRHGHCSLVRGLAPNSSRQRSLGAGAETLVATVLGAVSLLSRASPPGRTTSCLRRLHQHASFLALTFGQRRASRSNRRATALEHHVLVRERLAWAQSRRRPATLNVRFESMQNPGGMIRFRQRLSAPSPRILHALIA
jgi:hypothetical protein